MISLFSFLHTGTAFMVIVQFRGRLVRQYRPCVVDSLGLGITCALYHCNPDLVFFAFCAIPILFFKLIYPNLLIILVTK